MPDQNSTMAAINALASNRPLTLGALLAMFAAATLYTQSVSTQSVGGSLSGAMPNPVIRAGAITAGMFAPGAISGGTVIVVPTRTATGASDSTSSTDFVVCLDGPTLETLELAPPVGTTHVLKDCRPSGGAPIQVSTQGSDTIDGGSSVTFSVPRQAMTVSYSTLGWQVY